MVKLNKLLIVDMDLLHYYPGCFTHLGKVFKGGNDSLSGILINPEHDLSDLMSLVPETPFSVQTCDVMYIVGCATTPGAVLFAGMAISLGKKLEYYSVEDIYPGLEARSAFDCPGTPVGHYPCYTTAHSALLKADQEYYANEWTYDEDTVEGFLEECEDLCKQSHELTELMEELLERLQGLPADIYMLNLGGR